MKNKGFLVSVLIVVIAVLGIGWWVSSHKSIPLDTETQLPTPNPIIKTEVKSVFKTMSLGDLFFDYPSDIYTIQGRGITSDGLKPITLYREGTAQEDDIYISMRNIESEMKGYINEDSLRSDSVKGGVVFKKIDINGLTIYQSTIRFEMNNYVLQYVIMYKGNLYTFIVTPLKSQSKIAELEVNRKEFETILNSIRVSKSI